MRRMTKGDVGLATFTDTTSVYNDLMATRMFVPIDLYDIALLTLGNPDPLVLRWASSYYDVPFPSPYPEGGVFVEQVYAGSCRYAGSPVEASSPRPDGGALKHTIGVEVDTLTLDLLIDANDKLPPAADDAPQFILAEAVRARMFEGAIVVQRRLFLPRHPSYPIIHNHPSLDSSFDTSAGAYLRFVGQVTQSTVRGNHATLQVKALTERMAIGMPRHVWQSPCRFQVYDQMCRVDPLATGPDGYAFRLDTTILTPLLAEPPLGANQLDVDNTDFRPNGFFALGMLKFLTGKLAGFRASIREHAVAAPFDPNARVTLLQTLPVQPAIGDAVRLQRGCPKNKDACENNFGNFIDPDDHTKGLRFGGFPAIPPPETAV
jgi:Phage conserved hypothetical protein BR0599/Uncharacterized conserved protein (DUF2163)